MLCDSDVWTAADQGQLSEGGKVFQKEFIRRVEGAWASKLVGLPWIRESLLLWSWAHLGRSCYISLTWTSANWISKKAQSQGLGRGRGALPHPPQTTMIWIQTQPENTGSRQFSESAARGWAATELEAALLAARADLRAHQTQCRSRCPAPLWLVQLWHFRQWSPEEMNCKWGPWRGVEGERWLRLKN